MSKSRWHVEISHLKILVQTLPEQKERKKDKYLNFKHNQSLKTDIEWAFVT